MAQTPANYSVLWEDLTLMRDRAFYVPSKPGVASWNKEAPATRILVRADCLVKVRAGPRDPLEAI